MDDCVLAHHWYLPIMLYSLFSSIMPASLTVTPPLPAMLNFVLLCWESDHVLHFLHWLTDKKLVHLWRIYNSKEVMSNMHFLFKSQLKGYADFSITEFYRIKTSKCFIFLSVGRTQQISHWPLGFFFSCMSLYVLDYSSSVRATLSTSFTFVICPVTFTHQNTHVKLCHFLSHFLP